jgi:hypothetical protein
MQDVVETFDEPLEKPVGVKILAVLAILLGLAMFCYSPVGPVSLFLSDEPTVRALRSDSIVLIDTIVENVVCWLFAVVALALGFGLFRYKPWARKGAVVFAVLNALWNFVHGAFSAFVTTPKRVDIMVHYMPAATDEKAVTIVSVALAIAGLAFIILLDVIAIIYLTRPKVKAAFNPKN